MSKTDDRARALQNMPQKTEEGTTCAYGLAVLQWFDTWNDDIRQALSQQPIPEGWQAVPRQPTEDMMQAWYNTPHGPFMEEISPQIYLDMIDAYKAMLAAAPQPEEAK